MRISKPNFLVRNNSETQLFSPLQQTLHQSQAKRRLKGPQLSLGGQGLITPIITPKKAAKPLFDLKLENFVFLQTNLQFRKRKEPIPLLPLNMDSYKKYQDALRQSTTGDSTQRKYNTPVTYLTTRQKEISPSIKPFMKEGLVSKRFEQHYKNYKQVKRQISGGKLTSREYEKIIKPKCLLGQFSHQHLHFDQVSQLDPTKKTFKLVLLNYILNSTDSQKTKLQALQNLIKTTESDGNPLVLEVIPFLREIEQKQIQKIQIIEERRKSFVLPI